MEDSPIIELAQKIVSLLDGYDVSTATDSIALARIIVIDHVRREDDRKRCANTGGDYSLTPMFYGPSGSMGKRCEQPDGMQPPRA